MEIPQAKYARRGFYFTVALLCIFLVLMNFIIIPILFAEPIPPLNLALHQLVLALFTSIVTVTFVATLAWWLLPQGQIQGSDLHTIPAKERSEALERIRSNTQVWCYVGAVGRYNRAASFPHLAKQARSDNEIKSITIQILDPDDTVLCERYAQWRNGLRTTRTPTWSRERARIEILATIACAVGWVSQEPFLEVVIGLKKSWSTIRLDMSSHSAILTAEDPQYPAITCSSDSFLYRVLREDVRLGMLHARQLPSLPRTVPFSGMDGDAVRNIMTHLGLSIASLTDENLDTVATLARAPENPYA